MATSDKAPTAAADAPPPPPEQSKEDAADAPDVVFETADGEEEEVAGVITGKDVADIVQSTVLTETPLQTLDLAVRALRCFAADDNIEFSRLPIVEICFGQTPIGYVLPRLTPEQVEQLSAVGRATSVPVDVTKGMTTRVVQASTDPFVFCVRDGDNLMRFESDAFVVWTLVPEAERIDAEKKAPLPPMTWEQAHRLMNYHLSLIGWHLIQYRKNVTPEHPKIVINSIRVPINLHVRQGSATATATPDAAGTAPPTLPPLPSDAGIGLDLSYVLECYAEKDSPPVKEKK